ncbi:HEAT repeat protein [Pedobacter psychrotolerans]|uniref:HEAT repeat protein n=1 Tax=Pedobacter psychrotolerans TaxID=1843235 RepID=A0A4R2HDF1_9SPHI|nr:HEAT repeat domain-containing protein [Pedobacter psychrotolerans]TCO25414.1 HEAT repeat protein [Pedobacter psychrotolerans]GGE45596.1 hypothetical protein GCM10011413_09720 [Pedobacter psychrotolerans]
MDLDELKVQYKALLEMEDTDDGIFEFKTKLLSSDADEVLDFHLEILSKGDDEYLKRDLFAFFSDRKDKTHVGQFLYDRYKSGIEDLNVKADLIQILGHLRSKYAREVALENITIRKGDLRYRSIIVLGWVGTHKDLSVLNDRLLNDPDGQLRGYAATAMRQIWFNHPKTKDEILSYLKAAIAQEDDDRALEGIIITAQELLKKKLGLKESKYGDVTGDYQTAKVKTIDALKAY